MQRMRTVGLPSSIMLHAFPRQNAINGQNCQSQPCAVQACMYRAPCAVQCMAALSGGGTLLATDAADLQQLRAAPGGRLELRSCLGPCAPPRAFAVADLAGLSQNQARSGA